MESWMGVAMLIEATLFSFLVALLGTWMGLRGLFRLFEAMTATQLEPVPVRAAPHSRIRSGRHHAA
jgi:hypothetical protein